MQALQDVTYLNQEQAVNVDEQLMGPLGFSVDQLMELAGQAVACAVAAERPPSSRVLVLAGPGNNGGDGLVAARHLFHFGYDVQICYPKRPNKPLYNGLVTQCESLGLVFKSAEEVLDGSIGDSRDVVIDAMFGFSFHGPPRPPFDKLLHALSTAKVFIASVDIPSGWHVENGDESGEGLQPNMLISLTAPKLAARFFKGEHHYLGGRFVPPAIRDDFGLKLPAYPGISVCVKLAAATPNVADMRGDSSRLEESLDESDVHKDPVQQFDAWFKEAQRATTSKEPNAMALATVSADGAPSVRFVLLKGYSADGFVFYTNFDSRKGKELDSAGKAALCFYWESLNRQIRIEGEVERLSDADSEAYFHSRPRSSQIGAWVSAQSSVIESRTILTSKEEEMKERFADESKPVSKPPFWGGYRVVPSVIEFWLSRPSRLHDRLRYCKDGSDWRIERLSP